MYQYFDGPLIGFVYAWEGSKGNNIQWVTLKAECACKNARLIEDITLEDMTVYYGESASQSSTSMINVENNYQAGGKIIYCPNVKVSWSLSSSDPDLPSQISFSATKDILTVEAEELDECADISIHVLEMTVYLSEMASGALN